MATRVHHRDNDDVLGMHSKIDSIWKLAHQRAADFAVDEWKCERTSYVAFGKFFNGIGKLHPESRLPLLAAEKRARMSRVAAELLTDLMPRYSGFGVREVLAPATIKFSALVGS